MQFIQFDPMKPTFSSVKALSVAVTTLVICIAAPVRATLITGTFNGVVTSSLNAESVFNSSASLIGQTVTGTFAYDTALLPAMHPASTATLGAWLDAYAASPFVRMTQTINGQTKTYNSSYYEELDLAHGNPPFGGLAYRYQMFNLVSEDFLPLDGPSIYSAGVLELGGYDDSVSIVGDPHDPAVSFSLAVIPHGTGVGHWDDVDPLTRDTTYYRTWGFDVTSVSVGAQTVDEPASPATLAATLLGLGLLARRNRQPSSQQAPTASR